MGEDFVAHRQQRTVEMVRMKNKREETMLAMRLGIKGGLEGAKRYELNRFRQEKQRLMRGLDRMKSLKARPRYSDILIVSGKEVHSEVEKEGVHGIGDRNEVGSDEKEPKGREVCVENDAATYDRTKALIGFYAVDTPPSDSGDQYDQLPGLGHSPEVQHGTEPRDLDSKSPEHSNLERSNCQTVVPQGEVPQGDTVVPQGDTVAPQDDTNSWSNVSSATLPRCKTRNKKSKIERMYERSTAEFKRAKERMYTFMEALEDGEKWRLFSMLDSTLHVKERGDKTPNMSPSEQTRRDTLQRKSVPLNEINIEAIKEHIVKRLNIVQESQGSPLSPPHGSSRRSNGPRVPILPVISPTAEKPSEEVKPRPRRLSQLGKLGTIKEVEPHSITRPQSGDHGHWSKCQPPAEGVFIDDFDGQVLYDPEIYNPDGSFRAKHLVPEFEKSFAEAKKARYIRHGKDDTPEHEKDLSLNDIFGKSDEDHGIYELDENEGMVVERPGT